MPKILTNMRKNDIINILELKLFNYVLRFPRSWGVSGALYLQSATAGVIFCLGYSIVKLPYISDVDVWVLRNKNL